MEHIPTWTFAIFQMMLLVERLCPKLSLLAPTSLCGLSLSQGKLGLGGWLGTREAWRETPDQVLRDLPEVASFHTVHFQQEIVRYKERGYLLSTYKYYLQVLNKTISKYVHMLGLEDKYFKALINIFKD